MLDNLLIYRFFIFNVVILSIITYINYLYNDVVIRLIAQDVTGIVWGVIALFLAAWATTLRRVLETSHNINREKRKRTSKKKSMFTTKQLVVLRNKSVGKIKWLHDVSTWLVFLGLIGTVIGFKVALSGVDNSTLHDSSGVKVAIEYLLAGMNIALNTTIAGSICGMWNEINQRILNTALVNYWADRIHRSLLQQ